MFKKYVSFNKRNLIILILGFGTLLLLYFYQFKSTLPLIEDSKSLSEQEVKGLLLMREEEKLARDVYLTLGKKWNLPIFSNIAKSEQTHMDVIKDLLDSYNIPDPVKSNDIGEFTNKDLSYLYEELTLRGSTSLMEALQVGATIEDLDINDLQRILKQTDKADIIFGYKNLMKGSRNHLRAFVTQLEKRDSVYIPTYISQESYEEILISPKQKGPAQ